MPPELLDPSKIPGWGLYLVVVFAVGDRVLAGVKSFGDWWLRRNEARNSEVLALIATEVRALRADVSRVLDRLR